MRKSLSVLLSSTLILQTVFVNGVLAAPALTTANVNFRQGPGTNFGSLGTVPSGTQVEMENCDDSGAWCSISYNGQNGFVSGQYLQLSEPEQTTGWPRSFQTDAGATLESRLTAVQGRRFAKAYREAGMTAVEGFQRVLEGLLDAETRRQASETGRTRHPDHRGGE